MLQKIKDGVQVTAAVVMHPLDAVYAYLLSSGPVLAQLYRSKLEIILRCPRPEMIPSFTQMQCLQFQLS